MLMIYLDIVRAVPEETQCWSVLTGLPVLSIKSKWIFITAEDMQYENPCLILNGPILMHGYITFMVDMFNHPWFHG